MGIDAIAGNVAPPPVTTTPAVSLPKPEPIAPKHDSVQLSGIALAKSLKLRGQTPAQIALKMGLDVKTIDGYLGIAAKTPTTTLTSKTITPAPTATSVPQVNQAATDAAAAPQPYTPAEEKAEPASQKTTERLQGKQ